MQLINMWCVEHQNVFEETLFKKINITIATANSVALISRSFSNSWRTRASSSKEPQLRTCPRKPFTGYFRPSCPPGPQRPGRRHRRRSQPFAATWRAAAAAAPVVRGEAGVSVRPSLQSRGTTASDRACPPSPHRPGVAVSRPGSEAQSWNSLQTRNHGA